MSDFVKELLWLGVEDFTGLWDAAFAAQAIEGLVSLEVARNRARSVLESLLAEGLVDLYQFQGLPRNDAAPVAVVGRSGLLYDDGFWAAPEEEDDASVWFDTTEQGFQFYCEQYNGGALILRK